MMLSLELHTTHQNHPEKVGILIVSACDDLVLDKGMVYLLVIAVLALVVTDEDKRGVKASDQVSDEEVEQVVVVVEDDRVVDEHGGEFQLSY